MVVVTSNRPPRDLYAHGINRHLFVPFIELLEARVDHCDLDALADGAAVDFRRSAAAADAPLYVAPGGSAFADACAAVAGGAVAYERRAVAADAPIDALLDAPRGGAAAARAGDFEVRDEGGSSGKLTTFHADGTEWSATGLIGAAMGAVAGAADTQFAWDRTTSRLFEMTHGAPYRARWRAHAV
ncbi:AFG1 family ATPase [Aureococcus anophagefferens]|nr:AFG1 family ATPase [Aureococcus anophagefferens]